MIVSNWHYCDSLKKNAVMELNFLPQYSASISKCESWMNFLNRFLPKDCKQFDQNEKICKYTISIESKSAYIVSKLL